MGINKQSIFLHVNEKQQNCTNTSYDILRIDDSNRLNKMHQCQNTIIDPTYLQTLELIYTSCTIKDLHLILDYYGIKKKRLKKNEIVKILSLYEADSNNQLDVEERFRIWGDDEL
jgi:hypothetical protein